MAYDVDLAIRIRELVNDEGGVSEKQMFGGIAFLRDGKMFCGIIKDDLMVRVGAERYAAALARPFARPMDFNPRMKAVGYVFVGPEGGQGATLAEWVRWGLEYVATLPAKKAKPAAKAKKKPAKAKKAPSSAKGERRADRGGKSDRAGARPPRRAQTRGRRTRAR